MKEIVVLILTFLILVALKKLYDKFFHNFFHKFMKK